jgi:hypothetical protein
MKKIYLLIVFVCTISFVQAQFYATTTNGRRVILYADGTWQVMDSTNYQPVTDVSTLYNEAYQYAYDIMYSDEFFPTERRTKATQWAIEYVKSGLNLAIGRKSLDSWYDDLNNFAYNLLYKDIFFSTERRAKAAQWAAQTIKSKAYYEDFSISFITKHKAAYNLAYNRIFKTEFFAQDRRKKALNWANEFVKR